MSHGQGMPGSSGVCTDAVVYKATKGPQFVLQTMICFSVRSINWPELISKHQLYTESSLRRNSALVPVVIWDFFFFFSQTASDCLGALKTYWSNEKLDSGVVIWQFLVW